MPSLAMDFVVDGQVEILEPERLSRSRSFHCECCCKLRAAEEFDPDSCGICSACLECDDLLLDWDNCIASARLT